jgi:hypothetical protein
MKKKMILIVLLAIGILVSVLYLQAGQTIREERQTILPASHEDAPHLIKAFISRMKEALETDRDSLPSLISEVERYAEAMADSPPAAVLHSMAAEMYEWYYGRNRWNIDRRTPIEGFIPEDIREWAPNLFAQKIREEIKASLLPAEALQQTPLAAFKDILKMGKDSASLRPTLYDFLAHRAIEIQPSEEIYENLLAFRRSQPDRKAALLVELDYLHYRRNKAPYSSLREQTYEAALDSLMEAHAGEDYSTEIAYAKLELLDAKLYQVENKDSILTVEYLLCKDILARFAQYERISLIANWLAAMEEQEIQAGSEQTVYPGEELKIRLHYRNIAGVSLRVYQASSRGGALVKELSFALALKNSYCGHDTTLSMGMEKNGRYEYVLTSPATSLRVANTFSVTRLAAVSRITDSGQAEVLATDYRSGKPMEQATVNYYSDSRPEPLLRGSVKTDAFGLALLPSGRTAVSAYQVSLPGDEASPLTRIYSYAGRGQKEAEARVEVKLFTDRGIYRPGQTLFFKGIAYLNEAENPRVAPGRQFEVILRDANYREVATQSFTTNSFGSFHGEFTLPRQTLTGRFSLSTANGFADIQVEEYKRPTFRIELPPVKEDIAFGDEVWIRGKAQTFSGIPLTAGELSYRVILRPFLLRSLYGNRIEEQVAEGKVGVNEDGTFSFAFCPEKRDQSGRFSFQSYEILTTLTDSKGETQEARAHFSVGDRSLVLFADLPAKVDKDSAGILITAQTLNGETVTTDGAYTLYLLEKTEADAGYKEVRKLAEGSFTSGQSLGRGILTRLPSGNVRLHLSATDSKGRTVSEQQDFILYSRRDKRPPVFSHTWLLTDKNECMPGEEAEIVFGTSDREVYLLYELFSKGAKVSGRIVRLSNENQAFRIPFSDSYGEGVVASFTFIKEGKLYTEQTSILRKRPDRRLSLKPETFRDKLLPGSAESWTFRVSDAQALPAEAEVLAGMYDASTDYIRPFAWHFAPVRPAALYYRHFTESEGMRSRRNSDRVSLHGHGKEAPPFLFEHLDWQGAFDLPVSSRGSAEPVMMMKAMAPSAASAEVMNEDIAVVEETMNVVDLSPEADRQETNASLPQLRMNFNETAFFFPSLLTDREGNVVISFRLPESNTSWKLQALAHTTDLKYGLLTKEVVTQKPFMILPNLPRFMRKGDEVHISAQIINFSGQETSGSARLEVFNPADESMILPVHVQAFSLAANGVTNLDWTVNVPETAGLAGCRLIATSEAGSDGEQHLLPVLSDELLVTESLPIYLSGTEEKHLKLPEAGASSTRRLHSMTLEFSSNPVWYAIQALPSLAQPEHNNIVSWFASYYSHALAASIAQSNPHIRKVVSQWQAEGATGSGLHSTLEQNEELKNTLLEETPWVLEAKTETERKQRLSLLFDTNRTAMQSETAMRELLSQQHEQGGWGWFKGFYPDRLITSYILRGLSQLSRLGAVQYRQQEKEMQLKALSYLDKAIERDYDETVRKSKAPPHDVLPSPLQLYYLFVRSDYRDIPEPTTAREAIRYYTEQAGKHWAKASLYEKGEIALLMHRNGRKEIAEGILAWLRKTATISGEKGMYWANNRRENNFFISPIDVHSLLMSVFHELGTDTSETDRMKQWLLNQKRTQNWESVPATANAIYSLLEGGSNWTAADNHVVLQWGNKTWHTSEGETATGYIKETISGTDLSPLMQTLSLHGEGKSPSWGAVYYQYFESIGKVKKQQGALSVEKKLFIETNDGHQRQLTPARLDKPFKTGDKVIVRLTIRADRDMEYVSLKDLRAGCFEPAVQQSGFMPAGGLLCYHSPKDVSENFYFDRLPQGTYVLEYVAYVSRSGRYSNGMASLQCLYAPEFVSHTEGNIIFVQE